MKNALLKRLLSASIMLAVAIGSIGIVPLSQAEAGDSAVFNMIRSAGAISCLDNTAFGRVTISDLGPVQNMHVEVFHLPAKTKFALCVIQVPNKPFGLSWYQGEI